MPVTLKLVTPVKVLQPEQGAQVTLIASDGEIGIRQGHAPLVALVGHGRVEVTGGKRFAVRGGVAQVLKDEVNVLVDEAIEASAINVAKVQARLDAVLGGAAASGDDEVAWLRAQLAVAAR
jgi:F-type H+-transporting ATPase subunit epsilon